MSRVGRKITQYSLEGDVIQHWDSVGGAARELGFHMGNIHMCCSGQKKTYKNFVWRFFEDDFDKYPISTRKKREVKESIKKYYCELIYEDRTDYFTGGCLVKIKEFFSLMKDEPGLVECRIYENPTKSTKSSTKSTKSSTKITKETATELIYSLKITESERLSVTKTLS